MEIVDQIPENAQKIDIANSVAISPQDVSLKKFLIQDFQLRKPIKFQNTDGSWVGMAQPKVSLTQFVHGIMKDLVFADSKMLGSFQAKITALLHITDIDDVAVIRPENYLQYLALEQRLGIDGVDLCQYAWMEAYPPITEKQLVIVGK